MNATPINPLSNPKGVKLVCELCGKPAYLRCEGCRVTYYCDKDHQTTDWRGIHEKICQLLIPLRTPVAILGSEEERAHRQTQTRHRQVQLLELTKTEAHKKLFEGKYDLAIPAALQALRFSMSVHGQNSIHLVPSYLLLGEASIGLKQTTQAEDYLSLAKWAVMKKGNEVDNPTRAQLHRNFGLLYSAKGVFEEALEHLALDIYYSSVEVNDPEHNSVSGGYFQLATVFEKQNRLSDATAIYNRIVSIWKTALLIDLRKGGLVLDEAQEAEALQMLTHIHTHRTTSQSSNPEEVLYVLGLLHHHCGRDEKAREVVGRALEGYETSLGVKDPATVEVRGFVTILDDLMRGDGVQEKLNGGGKLVGAVQA